MCALWALMVVGSAVRAAGPRNYVFFGLDRERIQEHVFLDNKALDGAQLTYTWRELEPRKGEYGLEPIVRDAALLKEHGKGLFVQIQDVSFDPKVANVPAYLRTDPAYSGGADVQYRFTGDGDEGATPDGWMARRWDPAVRARFALLLKAMGEKLDGKIAGINLAETATAFGGTGKYFPKGFTYEAYRDGIKDIMKAARAAFATSDVIVYANFMPGEWLPYEDHGYLRSIYDYAGEIGVGVGGPDLLPFRKGERNNSYLLMHERGTGVVAGIAVQEGNYDDVNPRTRARVTVEELHAYATDYLKVGYIFWGAEEPAYSVRVLPYLRRLQKAGPARMEVGEPAKASGSKG